MGVYTYIAYKSKPIETPFCTIHRYKYLEKHFCNFSKITKMKIGTITNAWGDERPTFGIIGEPKNINWVYPMTSLYWHDSDDLAPAIGCVIKIGKKYEFITRIEFNRIFKEQTGIEPRTAIRENKDIFIKDFDKKEGIIVRTFLEDKESFFKGRILKYVEML